MNLPVGRILIALTTTALATLLGLQLPTQLVPDWAQGGPWILGSVAGIVVLTCLSEHDRTRRQSGARNDVLEREHKTVLFWTYGGGVLGVAVHAAVLWLLFSVPLPFEGQTAFSVAYPLVLYEGHPAGVFSLLSMILLLALVAAGARVARSWRTQGRCPACTRLDAMFAVDRKTGEKYVRERMLTRTGTDGEKKRTRRVEYYQPVEEKRRCRYCRRESTYSWTERLGYHDYDA